MCMGIAHTMCVKVVVLVYVYVSDGMKCEKLPLNWLVGKSKVDSSRRHISLHAQCLCKLKHLKRV